MINLQKLLFTTSMSSSSPCAPPWRMLSTTSGQISDFIFVFSSKSHFSIFLAIGVLKKYQTWCFKTIKIDELKWFQRSWWLKCSLKDLKFHIDDEEDAKKVARQYCQRQLNWVSHRNNSEENWSSEKMFAKQTNDISSTMLLLILTFCEVKGTTSRWNICSNAGFELCGKHCWKKLLANDRWIKK